MAKNKKKTKDTRKMMISIFALVICAMMAILTVVSSFYMIAG